MSNYTMMTGTVVVPHDSWNIANDCERLHGAIFKFRHHFDKKIIDSATIINILCHRCWHQRVAIKKRYVELYNRHDLSRDLISANIDATFYQVIKRLLKTPVELAAFEINQALDDFPQSKTDCLIEMICTRTSDQLRDIKFKYYDMYGKNLDDEIRDNLVDSTNFKVLLRQLLKCDRDLENETRSADIVKASLDAKVLYKAGRGNLTGTDEMCFIDMLTGRNYVQLREIFIIYQRTYKMDIKMAIKSQFSGDLVKALFALVGAIRNRPGYYASRLHQAISCGGDIGLVRIIVSRCEIDLARIKAEYIRIYNQSLIKAVRDKTSGDCKKSLLALLGN